MTRRYFLACLLAALLMSSVAWGQTTMSGDVAIGGGLDAASVESDGIIAGGGDVTATDDLIALDDMSCGDDAVVGDSLSVGGNIVVGSFSDSTSFKDDLSVGADLKVDGALLGARDSFTFVLPSTAQTGDRWLYVGTTPTTADAGPVMARNGSVVDVSLYTDINSYTPVATWEVEVYVDGVDVYDLVHTAAATGHTYDWDTQPRGTDTFSAGDHISVRVDVTGTINYDLAFVVVGVQYDD